MFKIDFFVEDKHLPAVLHSINGKALNLQVAPVVNAVVAKDKRGRPNGKLKQNAEHTMGLFLKELKAITGDAGEISAANAKTALEKAGLSPTSNNYFLKQAVKARLIKKGKRGTGMGHPMMWSWV